MATRPIVASVRPRNWPRCTGTQSRDRAYSWDRGHQSLALRPCRKRVVAQVWRNVWKPIQGTPALRAAALGRARVYLEGSR